MALGGCYQRATSASVEDLLNCAGTASASAGRTIDKFVGSGADRPTTSTRCPPRRA